MESRRQMLDNEEQSARFLTNLEVLQEIDSWIAALLNCHEFAVRQASASNSPAGILEAYAQISSVALSSAEAARLLLLRGFYGNTLGVLRLLASLNDLLLDLCLSDESLKRWMALRTVPFSDESRETKQERLYFHDSKVRKRLKANGEKPLSAGFYSIASEAVHASARGSAFYLVESLTEPGLHTAQFDVRYNPERALTYGVLLLSFLPHLCGFFFEKLDGTELARDPEFGGMAARHLVNLRRYEQRDRGFAGVLDGLGAAQDRLKAGEDFDAVFPG